MGTRNSTGRRGIASFRLLCIPLIAALAACSTIEIEQAPRPTSQRERGEGEGQSKIFGKDGLTLFGGKSETDSGGGGGGIGVNSYLWRASLDTLSFMPLSSADPFGGVIITDWYSPPESPLERFKMTVYILDRRLRADALKVAVFRQSRVARNAGWNDSEVASATPIELEDAILSRARELRVASIPASE